MTKYSMRSIPAAAAMAAALLFGAQVYAQTGMTTPPGSTRPEDRVNPAPGNNATPARAGAEGNNSSGSPVGRTDTMIGGTTSKKDDVSPAPVAGNGSTGKTAAAGMNGPGTPTMVPGTTSKKDNVMPSPTAGTAMSAEERAAAKSARAEKRAMKKKNKTKTKYKNAAGPTTPEEKAHAN